jgi:hypothetical protein
VSHFRHVVNHQVDIAEQMIEAVDQDGNGTLDLSEFVIMMTVGDMAGDGSGGGGGGGGGGGASNTGGTVVQGVSEDVAAASKRAAAKAAAEVKKFVSQDLERSNALVAKIQRAWRAEDQKFDFDSIQSEYLKAYLKVSLQAERIASHPAFVSAMTATIVAAGVVVGIQTELADPAQDDQEPNQVMKTRTTDKPMMTRNP